MPIEFKNNKAKLSGLVSVEEAETLFNWLLEKKKPKVDLSELQHLHTACLQLLFLFKPEIIAFPKRDDLRMFLSFGEENK
uniref:Uncharacterized protein n=1 Tax=candidate division WOR-3 bacterium TaxID=2052148 RepID=A0A7C2K1L0_UNCW3